MIMMRKLNNTILILVLLLLLIPVADAVTYCDGDLLRENITVNDNVINIATHVCANGCYDNITATGGACGLPQIYTVTIAFGLIISFIIFIFIFPRLLKKGRRR